MNHVVMLLPGIDRLGGAELQVLQLARGMRERGWKVTVVTLSGNGGEAGPELWAAGIGYFSLRMRKGLVDPSGWIRLRQWIRRNRPDVLHAHLPHAAWFARWSRLFAPVRVVLDTVHTSSCGTIGRGLGYRYSNWLVDKVTAVSESAAYAYCGAGMVSPDRLCVIPNAVDTCFWKPAGATRQSIRMGYRVDEEFVWLAAGRLEPVKNYHALLEAFAQLPSCASLKIAGTGPLERELRDQCNDLGLESRVGFLGFERDLLHWMQAADAFVLTSHWEGLPMVLLEAGACGLPAVATNVSGSRDVLLDGVTGMLAEPGSVPHLADLMTKLMRMDSEQRKIMGSDARRRVKDHFRLDVILDKWEACYSELLSRHPHPSRYRRS